MYISKKDREIIRQKFNGKCAYTGTKLLPDWEVDHVKAVRRNWFSKGALFENEHQLGNMFPCQRIVNNYKGSLDLEDFRTWLLGGLHERLKNLPKNPNTEKSIKRKAYLLEIARLFDITPDKPFSGVFYFEKINNH